MSAFMRAFASSYERFGITATPPDQHVWYDDPDGPYHWPLFAELSQWFQTAPGCARYVVQTGPRRQ